VRVFVTGGTGFVGSHVVEALLEGGHEVVCLVRTPSKATNLFRKHSRRSLLSTVEGTLHDTSALERGCAGADAVFHIAGLTAARSRAEFRAINDHATRDLAAVARQIAPDLRHFVYLSSLAAAGPTSRGTPKTEADPERPVSDYGWSKLAGEKAVRESPLPWTIVRPPTVYGPRDREILKVFKVAKLGLAPVFGDGRQENSFIFAPDLAQALVACIGTDASVGQVFFAAHPEVRDQRQLAAEVFRALRGGPGSGTPFVVPIPATLARGLLQVTGSLAAMIRQATILNADRANDFLAEAWTCSADALIARTGWKAHTDLATGMRATAQWYRTHGWL
jgi:nucleoside-diphosphate-sugar epimerase